MQFAYRAVDNQGANREGRLQAGTREQALAQLQTAGLIVWELAAGSEPLPELKLSLRDRSRFFLQLSILLASGVPLVRGLEGMGMPVASYLASALARGQRMSEAMARLSTVFAPAWVQIVALGEETGSLMLVLRRLSDQLDRAQQNRSRLIQTLIYPTFTLLGAGATLVLLVFVMVPRFVSLAVGPGRELPEPTRLLLALSQPWVAVALAWILVVGILVLYARRAELIGLAYRLPGLGLARSAWADFCRQLALLLEAGLPLEQSLALLARGAPDNFRRQAIQAMLKGLRQGEDIPGLFAACPGMPPMICHLVAVGAETGRLTSMLERVGAMLEEESEERLRTFLTLLEPILMGGCGLVVGFVVMAAFLPAYRLPLEGGF